MTRPLAIIWDIENCKIPKNTSATGVVIALRKYISDVFPDTELCQHFYSTFACDSVINVVDDERKTSLKTVESLIICGVTIFVVNNIRENAADEILINQTRLFAKCYDSAVIVFITSDVDYCDIIREVKGYGHTVMVIHRKNGINDEMKSVIETHVNKSAIFKEIIGNVGADVRDKSCSLSQHLIIENISPNVSRDTIKTRLTTVSNSVLHNIELHGDESKDTITFACLKDAERAEMIMNGMTVFGRKITATVVKNEDYAFMLSLRDDYISPYLYDDTKYTERVPTVKRINWINLLKAPQLKQQLQCSIKSKSKKRKIMTDFSLASSSSSSLSASSISSLSSEYISLKCGVTLTRPDYYTIPTIEQMDSHYDLITDTCFIDSLTVGRHNYGSIYWGGPFDIKGLNLDEIIHIRRKEAIVYPDDDSKPEVGESLNRPAQITLHQVWPIDTTTHEVIKDLERLRSIKYAEKVESATLWLNAQFKEYRPDTGSWVFDVKHFSKYGMTENDEKMEDANDTTQSKRIVESKELSVESKFPPKRPEMTKILHQNENERLYDNLKVSVKPHELSDEISDYGYGWEYNEKDDDDLEDIDDDKLYEYESQREFQLSEKDMKNVLFDDMEVGDDTMENIPLKSSSGSSLNSKKDVRNPYDASYTTSQLSPPNLYSLQPMNVLSYDLYRNPNIMSHVSSPYSQSHAYPMVVKFRNFLSLYNINVHELSFSAFYALLMRNHFSFENTMSELMMIVPRYDNGHLSRVPFPDHHSKY